jgi:hypothetical protein
MKRVVFLVVVALALIALPGASALAQPTSATIVMNEDNGSGENGTATLTDMGNGQTMVVINLQNGTATPQPAHIHEGSCPNVGKVVHPLATVVNGTSETTVPASLASLLNGTFAINVHKSGAEASVYVSCGNIVWEGQTSGVGTGTPGMPTTGNAELTFTLLGLALLALAITSLGFRLARRKA